MQKYLISFILILRIKNTFSIIMVLPGKVIFIRRLKWEIERKE